MSVVKSIQLGGKCFLEVSDEYDMVIKAEGNTKRAHFTASIKMGWFHWRNTGS